MFKKWCLSIVACTVCFYPLSASAVPSMTEAKKLVKTYYYPPIASKNMQKAKSMKELVSLLDPYSTYMTAAEYKHFLNDVNRTFVGIGIIAKASKKGIEIVSIIPGGTAEKKRMTKGDIITSINNQAVDSMSFQKAFDLLKGKENTDVTLTFISKKTNKVVTKTMKRMAINLPIVETKKLAGNVGYIRLNSFSPDSATRVQRAMKQLPHSKSWILDVRDNGGGDVRAAEKVIGLFKRSQLAYFVKYGKDKQVSYQVPQRQKQTFNGPVAVLINKNSASATEMTAGALKGQRLATLYGQTTYGKGVMQAFFKMSHNGGFMKLTVGEFFAPHPKTLYTKINKVGISPNVKTAKGKELFVSHKALLQKTFVTKKKLPSISQSAKSKAIIIRPSSNLTWKQLSTARVSLLQIGSTARKIDVKKAANHQLKIIATSGLKSSTAYYVTLTPKVGKATYSYVTVK